MAEQGDTSNLGPWITLWSRATQSPRTACNWRLFPMREIKLPSGLNRCRSIKPPLVAPPTLPWGENHVSAHVFRVRSCLLLPWWQFLPCALEYSRAAGLRRLTKPARQSIQGPSRRHSPRSAEPQTLRAGTLSLFSPQGPHQVLAALLVSSPRFGKLTWLCPVQP